MFFPIFRRARNTSVTASTFSGTFTTSAATATVTSATRTYTLGSGNSGTVKFTSVATTGSGTSQYSKNGGSFTGNDITEGMTIVLASTDTLALRTTGLTSGQNGTFNVVDNDTSTNIESVTLSRT